MARIGLSLVAALFVFGDCLLEDETCPRKHHALAVAFLPLHRGENCRELFQRGVQQRVALETALEVVNAGNDLKLGLKVFDTCSTREKAVEAVAKGRTFAETRCSKFPVFLGFLGPDDEESIRAVGLAGTIQNYSHVVPAAVASFQQFSDINVEIINTQATARRITTFLRYLHWHSFVLVFTSDTASTRIALSILESGHFCVTNSVLRVPAFASDTQARGAIRKLRRTVEEVENVRIVIVTDDTEVMRHFTDEMWERFEYVIHLRGSGILPWRGSKNLLRNTIILQDVSLSPLFLPNFEETLANSTIWQSYMTQVGSTVCDDCRSSLQLDKTIVPYVYSIHLLSRALKMVTRKKCRGSLICDSLKKTTPQEWRPVLAETVTVVEGRKVGFYMNLETGTNVIAYRGEELDVVGRITEEVSAYRPDAIRRSNRSRIKQCMVDMYQYEMEPEAVVLPPRVETTERPVVDEQKVPLNFGYYELMATVIGFPIGLVLLIGLTVACVYRSYRTDSHKCDLSSDRVVEDYS